MPSDHVLLGFSGGMDSFAAALLLKEKGYRVTAVHLILHDVEPASSKRRLRALAGRLDIPLISVDLRDAFRENIIRPFAESYLGGKTPNPCVWCNEQIKCQGLLALLKKYDARWIATGHYSRKVPHPETRRWIIARGADRSKDQSYFLSFVRQEQLDKLLLPLGNKLKEDLRSRLTSLDSSVTAQRESHDICFLKGESYRKFLDAWVPGNLRGEGAFIDASGHVLGTHRGFFHYTVGQRKGIGIADRTPYYVTALIPERNQVRIGKESDLYKSIFTVTACHWHLPPPGKPAQVLCQIRFRHAAAPATLRTLGPYRAEVHFKTPQRAITPGQIAAFYQQDWLIGAGVIEKVRG